MLLSPSWGLRTPISSPVPMVFSLPGWCQEAEYGLGAENTLCVYMSVCLCVLLWQTYPKTQLEAVLSSCLNIKMSAIALAGAILIPC